MLLAQPALDSAMQWHAWLEYQPRWDWNTLNLYQTVLRPGIGKQLSSALSFWVGYAWIGTFRPRWSGEHRLWQQVQWIANGNLNLRSRIEERFFMQGSELRLRGQARVTIPVYLFRFVVVDELFVTVAGWGRSTPLGYDQNRFTVGVLVPLWHDVRAELSYTNIHYPTKPLQHVVTISFIY